MCVNNDLHHLLLDILHILSEGVMSLALNIS